LGRATTTTSTGRADPVVARNAKAVAPKLHRSVLG
jgi:hypothetical protein